MITSIKEIHDNLLNKQFSSTELTKYCLDNIKKYQHLNALLDTNSDEALRLAADADKRIHNNDISYLTGIPVVHKDNLCTTNYKTTAASKMLANYTSPFDATVVTKLNKAGTVLLGKANMDEFAFGSRNESSYFGPVLNPWDNNHVPGGSSGGSAAVVGAKIAPIATGSDTGGSIRQPAAFCGISGLKPTYGLVSRFGLIAFASSLDQIGPMARSAEDLSYVLQEMTGFDPLDSTSSNKPKVNYVDALKENLPSNLKIGVPSYINHTDIDDQIKKATNDLLLTYEKNGATIKEIEISLHDYWVPTYYILATAEASSNLARFDGVRFGHRSKVSTNIKEMISHSRSEGFGEEVKRRVLTGTHVLSSGYFDAYYVKAQKTRRKIKNELLSHLSDVDLIIGPTTPTPAFLLKEQYTNPAHEYLADIFTVGANLAGLPALSIPAGFSGDLPIGVQIMGNYFTETLLLQAAHYFQSITDWHTRNVGESDGI